MYLLRAMPEAFKLLPIILVVELGARQLFSFFAWVWVRAHLRHGVHVETSRD